MELCIDDLSSSVLHAPLLGCTAEVCCSHAQGLHQQPAHLVKACHQLDLVIPVVGTVPAESVRLHNGGQSGLVWEEERQVRGQYAVLHVA